VKARNEDEENKIYCYQGDRFEQRAGLSKSDYIDKVIQVYFTDVPKEKIIIKDFELGDESEEGFFASRYIE
jgi:hypothetical protein